MKIKIILGFVLFLAVLAPTCRERVSNVEGRVFKLTDTDKTPMGATVRREAGTAITVEAMNAIDRGITKTLAKAQCKYGRSLTHRDYIVAWIKGVPDSNGDPAYKLPCGPYCGTEYDKGGYILVAGQVVASGVPFGNIIVFPEHRDRFAHLEIIAEFEPEHIELAYWDGDEYERTKIHGNGAGHPIMAPCSGTKGLEDKKNNLFFGDPRRKP